MIVTHAFAKVTVKCQNNVNKCFQKLNQEFHAKLKLIL